MTLRIFSLNHRLRPDPYRKIKIKRLSRPQINLCREIKRLSLLFSTRRVLITCNLPTRWTKSTIDPAHRQASSIATPDQSRLGPRFLTASIRPYKNQHIRETNWPSETSGATCHNARVARKREKILRRAETTFLRAFFLGLAINGQRRDFSEKKRFVSERLAFPRCEGGGALAHLLASRPADIHIVYWADVQHWWDTKFGLRSGTETFVSTYGRLLFALILTDDTARNLVFRSFSGNLLICF